jgi:uncharacterized protein
VITLFSAFKKTQHLLKLTHVFKYWQNESVSEPMFSQEDLIQIARQSMPFGKYQGTLLIDLPEPYLIWFQHKGWPEGRLGNWLQLVLEIKINGLESLVEPLKKPIASSSTKVKKRITFD